MLQNASTQLHYRMGSLWFGCPKCSNLVGRGGENLVHPGTSNAKESVYNDQVRPFRVRKERAANLYNQRWGSPSFFYMFFRGGVAAAQLPN